MSRAEKRAWLIFVLGTALIAVFWMLSIHNAFVFDDSSIFGQVSLSTYDELFSFYPSSVYLDRPVRNILLKLMYDLFGLDYTLHHAALVCIHIFNMVIAFLAAERVFAMGYGKDSDKPFVGACITSLIFGAWPVSSWIAVQWCSAFNDLIGTTFALLSFLFYLRSVSNENYKGQNICLEVFFFYLAIRTKEMFYLLPLVFVLCELYGMLNEKRKKHLTAGTIAGLFVMVIFLAGMLYCKLQDREFTVDASEPYYQSFNPVSMTIVLLKYCMTYFDLVHSSMTYEFSWMGLIFLGIVVSGLVWAVVRAVRQKYGLLLCYISIALSIAVVLPMVNQVHRLYLYFPSFFVGAAAAVVILELARHPERVIAYVGICCVCACNAKGPTEFRNFWYTIGDMENKAYQQLEAIPKPEAESNVYIRLENTEAYTPFFYGSGAIVKLVYQDSTLATSVHTMDENIEYKAPYVVLEYTGGNVYEAARDETRTLTITDLYSAMQEDGTMIIGLVPEKITDTLKIHVDGTPVQTVVGEDFISATVPADLLKGKDSVSITVSDAYGTVSNPLLANVD